MASVRGGLETDMVPWFHVLAQTGFALFKRIISDKATNGGTYMSSLVFLTSILGILSYHMAGNITALLTMNIHAKAFIL